MGHPYHSMSDIGIAVALPTSHKGVDQGRGCFKEQANMIKKEKMFTHKQRYIQHLALRCKNYSAD